MTKRKEKKNYEVTQGNIFAELGLDHPEELLARSKLLTEVCKLIKSSKRTQKEIAVELGITQSKVSLLMKGRLSAFSTETLLHYLSLLGCNIDIRLEKPRSTSKTPKRKGHIAVHQLSLPKRKSSTRTQIRNNGQP